MLGEFSTTILELLVGRSPASEFAQDELFATLHALTIAHPAGGLTGFSGQLLPAFLARRFPQLQPHSLALLQRIVDPQQPVHSFGLVLYSDT